MDSNDELVDYLKAQGRLTDPGVEKALRSVDRGFFVPETQEKRAYVDRPLPLGNGATISAPHMVAVNTELLEVDEGDTVLEVGSGSGYQLAVLAELTGERVVGLERLEKLVKYSSRRLESWGNVKVVHGESLDDIEGSFDRILYSCAIESMEHARSKLADGGVVVAPVIKSHGQVLTKFKDGKVTEHGPVRFVPFIQG